MEIVLNTFGVLLNRDNEAFVITSKDGRQRNPVDDIKSIQISRGTQITSDAVTLRGWEGQASRIYFSTIVKYLPLEYQFEQRSQHPAMDVTNAFLNYGYGILYGRYEEYRTEHQS